MVAWWMVLVVAASPVRSVDGGLPKELVHELIGWHSPEVNACLAGAAKRASVRYRFRVGADGRVTQLAFLDSQKVESPRVTCIGTALEKWRFPPADGGSVIEWDFSVSHVDAGVPAEPEDLALEQVATAWVDDALRCYDATGPSEEVEGRLSLELLATPGGAVVQGEPVEVAPALAATELSSCLTTRALSWSLPAASAPRRLQTHWVFATSELRAKRFFIPASPAREVIALHPKPPPPGGLDKDVIMAEIRRANARIKACYELGLHDRPTLAGKVAIAFRIGPDGRVDQKSVAEDELHHAPATDCLLDVVGRMEFPPPQGGGVVNVTFPWIFQSAISD